jgi:hypothetical protein
MMLTKKQFEDNLRKLEQAIRKSERLLFNSNRSNVKLPKKSHRLNQEEARWNG